MTSQEMIDSLETILIDIQFEYRNLDYPDSEEEHDKKVMALKNAIELISSIDEKQES